MSFVRVFLNIFKVCSALRFVLRGAVVLLDQIADIILLNVALPTVYKKH